MSTHLAPPILDEVETGRSLRLLSLNIQNGLHTSRYSQYLTHAWRHVWPTRDARDNLDRIAALAAPYDIVALQEADAGSLRTASVNQVAYIAERAGFPYWHAAVTRNLRPIAKHCLGCLSRWPLDYAQYHALPGWLPGRGALQFNISLERYESLRIIIAHLALGRRARTAQLAYLARLVKDNQDTIILGDFNCDLRELSGHADLAKAGLRGVVNGHTFPSWRPFRALDHILVSPTVEVIEAVVLNEHLSDHLPVATEVRLRLERRP